MDIKGKHVDLEVLRILVNGIKNNSVECDMPALKKDALQLLGRLTSKVRDICELKKRKHEMEPISLKYRHDHTDSSHKNI